MKTMQENTQRHIQNIKISALSGVGIIFIEVILVLFTIAFKGIDLSFIKLDFEDLMKIIAFLGLLSLGCFLIAIYGVKKYSSARNLFVNIFIIFFVNIVLSIGLFLNLNFMENHYFFRSEKNLANALLLLTYFYTFMCIIFLALKNFYYELARVTKQKYFINAFWCLFIGILFTPIMIGIMIGIVLLIIGMIFYVVAWVELQELSSEIPQTLKSYQTYKGNLNLVKTLFISAGILILVLYLGSFLLEFYFKDESFSNMYSTIQILVMTISLILGFIATILFCKNTKKWILTLYFVLGLFSIYAVFIFALIIDLFSLHFFVFIGDDFSILRGIIAPIKCIFVVLFLLKLSKITHINLFKIASLSFIASTLPEIFNIIYFFEFDFKLYSENILAFMFYADILFIIFFIIAVSKMKKDKMSF